MHTIIFDIAGEYGQFKKPYSPMSPVTFPFPPPTAVLGMLGAIAGYGKNEYHERLGWNNVRIAIGLRAPFRVQRSALNLLNTKDADAFFRPIAGKNTHIQVPCEFLKAPAYRIFAADLPDAARIKLKEQFMSGRTVYTPVLGLAQCIADVEWIGEADAEPLEGTEERRIDSVVPVSEGMKFIYDEGRRYHRLRVPATMDSQRVVHQYREAVVAEDAQPVRVRRGKGMVHRVNDASVAFF